MGCPHHSVQRLYRLEVIGHADDTVEANGVTVLDFWQAAAKAQALIAPKAEGPFTVADAVADYLRHLEGRRSYRDTQLRLNAFALPVFGNVAVPDLAYDDLVKWHRI